MCERCTTPLGTCVWAPFNRPGPPLPLPPDPGESQIVRRHLGMYCCCPLIDCGHNEFEPDFESGALDRGGVTVWSGSPASGYLYPWEPGDESWRTDTILAI